MSDWEQTQPNGSPPAPPPAGQPTPPPTAPRRPLGPLITLVGGLILALILGTVSANAAGEELERQNAAQRQAREQAPAATTPPATTAPAAPPASAAPGRFRAAYAGRVDGGGASIAIAVRDGGAVAYLCDGRRIEAWMLGRAVDGRLELSDERGATLTGTYDQNAAAGKVTVGKRTFTLDVPVAKKPSGLYKSTATVRGARIQVGWIVLPGGDQVGIATTDGEPEPAPEIDVTTRTATVKGQQVTANSIDGTTGTGF